MCCVCRCFQNVVFLIFYNSTNSIDKVKFKKLKTKYFLNFLQIRIKVEGLRYFVWF